MQNENEKNICNLETIINELLMLGLLLKVNVNI